MTTTTRHAFLPESLEPDQPTIGTMVIGDSGWVTPWGMWVDVDRRCWLHPGYELHANQHGTVTMQVARREDGWHVWAPRGERWRPQNTHGYHAFAGEFVPVAEIHEGPR